MGLPHIEWEILSGLKVQKFECLGGNLGSGAILGDNPNFGGNFRLRSGSVRGTTRLPGMFFLTFFFYIVNFYFYFFLIVLYIY